MRGAFRTSHYFEIAQIPNNKPQLSPLTKNGLIIAMLLNQLNFVNADMVLFNDITTPNMMVQMNY
jgi:hypothetical protein